MKRNEEAGKVCGDYQDLKSPGGSPPENIQIDKRVEASAILKGFH